MIGEIESNDMQIYIDIPNICDMDVQTHSSTTRQMGLVYKKVYIE